ncbi:3-isopropylmalate dehydratase small subunit [Massilia sp. Bi118]|uniref:3-isopropylmalate dehydratase small subunit n=1 Tax=Massilia sp. Bi118 TaxID=2822346 RepID=UPI001D98449E|nr:3-isopropylmalate dehydratase small subunit [Massilia sp. Bi118]CAH0304986.1 3-isopropylmalate dehydratase small subunit [Massilia sp. Bi118]
MKPFDTLRSNLVPIDRENVDTDAILPKQYMAIITRLGFGDYLFDSWRYREPGAPGQDNSRRPPNPDFALNQPAYEGAQIMLARRNFGCGSSREHAVWAIQQYGIRALVAPSFADIFYGNCIRNGLLPVRLPADAVDGLFARLAANPRLQVCIDLEAQQLSVEDGAHVEHHGFGIEARHKATLRQGLDEIDRILAENKAAIEALESRRFAQEHWLRK